MHDDEAHKRAFENFTPRKNPPKKAVATPAFALALSETPLTAAEALSTLEKVAGMDKPALIALIKRVGGAMWGIALKTNEEIYQAMLDKAAYMALTADDVTAFVKASTQWMERTQGKVADRVEVNQTGTIGIVAVNLSETLRFLAGDGEGRRLEGESALPQPVPD